MKLYWITDRMAISGAVESLYDARSVAKAGITRVLNLRDGDKYPEHISDEAPWWHQLDIDYHVNGIHSDDKKDPEWVSRSLEYAFASLERPGCKLLIHCKLGLTRSPETAYAVLQAFGMPAKYAEECVLAARPEAEMKDKAAIDKAIKKLGYK